MRCNFFIGVLLVACNYVLWQYKEMNTDNPSCFGINSHHTIAQYSSDESSSTSLNSNDDEKVSAVSTIPDEILASIFTDIVIPERSKVREVCRQWKNIMDNWVGITVRVGTLSEFDPDTNVVPKYHSPSIMSDVGIEKLLVGNISPNWEVDHGWFSWVKQIINYIIPSKDATPLPSFKSPQIVALLNILGQICPTHFHHFLRELPWLRVLSLSFDCLQILRSRDVDTIELLHLQVFVVRSGLQPMHFTEREQIIAEWDLPNLLENIMSIATKSHFPKLEYGGLDFVYDGDKSLEITKAQLRFLQNHSKTIKSFGIQYCVLLNEDFAHVPPEHSEELTDITNSLKLDLKGMRILPLCFSRLPYSNIWTGLANRQRHVTDFTITGAIFPLSSLEEFVDKNYLTLTSIFIWEIELYDAESNSVVRLDCTMFNKCENLTKLSLRGWTVTLSVKNVMNVSELPRGLKHVDFRDMALTTRDIRYLGLELPKLETFELHFVGRTRDMGIDPATIRDIIRERRLKEVRIFRSVNGRLSANGIFNGDENEPENIVEQPGGFVAFEMGPNGFYINSEF